MLVRVAKFLEALLGVLVCSLEVQFVFDRFGKGPFKSFQPLHRLQHE